jgi:hypothetical protein
MLFPGAHLLYLPPAPYLIHVILLAETVVSSSVGLATQHTIHVARLEDVASSSSKLSNEAKDEDVEEVSIAYSLDISEVEGSTLLSSTNVQVDVIVTEQRGGRIIDPWCVLYADRGVLWTHHIFTFCIFVITYFTCDLIIIFIFP